MQRRAIAIGLAALSLAASAAPAEAGRLAPYVAGTLQRLEDAWGDRSFRYQPLFELELMTAGASQSWIVTPRAEYAIAMGACDTDCNSLTLVVTDLYDGTVVARGNQYNGTAEAGWPPIAGRSYRVHATLETCTTPSCYVAVTVAQ